MAVAVLLALLLFFPPRVFAVDRSLAIVEAGVERSEDAPFVSPDYRFFPGDFLYFTFQIAGFAINSDEQNEVRTISLTYEITPLDAGGAPLCPPSSGKIATELNPQDKNWMPKRRISFLIPSFVAAGDFHIHAVVKDLIAETETSKDFPFHIGGVEIQPSSTIAIENFHFFRGENDGEPLEVPAYRPGDTVYARFDMAGYQLGPENEYHLAYGLTVLRPDGKPFIQQPNAAELHTNSFYPARFVPGTLNLITPPDALHGEYVVVLTVRDLIGNQTRESRQAFSIE